MKKLKVPYLETLDVLDLSSVGFLMEKAQRESIDVINWEEYSYKPIRGFRYRKIESESVYSLLCKRQFIESSL